MFSLYKSNMKHRLLSTSEMNPCRRPVGLKCRNVQNVYIFKIIQFVCSGNQITLHSHSATAWINVCATRLKSKFPLWRYLNTMKKYLFDRMSTQVGFVDFIINRDYNKCQYLRLFVLVTLSVFVAEGTISKLKHRTTIKNIIQSVSGQKICCCPVAAAAAGCFCLSVEI